MVLGLFLIKLLKPNFYTNLNRAMDEALMRILKFPKKKLV